MQLRQICITDYPFRVRIKNGLKGKEEEEGNQRDWIEYAEYRSYRSDVHRFNPWLTAIGIRQN